MHPPANPTTSEGALSDPRQRYVRSTLLLLGCAATMATATASVLHTLQPDGLALNRWLPALMSIGIALATLRYWRHPDRLRSTIWITWLITAVGLAGPAWYFSIGAWGAQARLVDTLPPITAVLLPLLLVMVIFARPRFAWAACSTVWLLVAAPVLAYLAAHPDELWSPRGLDLAIAFGPVSLIIPLLIPLLRGVERRIETLQQDGERLQALAERDALVGVYNRRAGERFLSALLANAGHGAALVLFDVDHFKRVNDSYGHPAGDAVLVEIGRRCGALLGGNDLFARWGGEEFLIVAPGLGGAAGVRLAERLREAVRARPIAPVGLVTASFGVTEIRPDDTLGQVLQRADEALYLAKANGRDRVELLGPGAH